MRIALLRGRSNPHSGHKGQPGVAEFARLDGVAAYPFDGPPWLGGREAAEPREWESWRWIPWLVCAVYVMAFGIPLIDSGAASAVTVLVAVIALYALARWRRRRAARKRLQAQSGPCELLPDLSVQPAE